MDARVKSAFTRVHSRSKTGVSAGDDALLRAHDAFRSAPQQDCLYPACGAYRASALPSFWARSGAS